MEEVFAAGDHWGVAKTKIRGAWSNLTDLELDETRGNLSEITNLILEKNVETKITVIQRLVNIMHSVPEDAHF